MLWKQIKEQQRKGSRSIEALVGSGAADCKSTSSSTRQDESPKRQQGRYGRLHRAMSKPAGVTDEGKFKKSSSLGKRQERTGAAGGGRQNGGANDVSLEIRERVRKEMRARQQEQQEKKRALKGKKSRDRGNSIMSGMSVSIMSNSSGWDMSPRSFEPEAEKRKDGMRDVISALTAGGTAPPAERTFSEPQDLSVGQLKGGSKGLDGPAKNEDADDFEVELAGFAIQVDDLLENRRNEIRWSHSNNLAKRRQQKRENSAKIFARADQSRSNSKLPP